MQAEGKNGGVNRGDAGKGKARRTREGAKAHDAGCQPEGGHASYVLSGAESIAAIERSLPSLRGPDASVAKYEHRLQQVGDNHKKFYNKSSNTIKRHQWDSLKAYRAEYAIITDRF